MTGEESTVGTQQGGRFGRTPHLPGDLREEYGTVESGRLDVRCPGCGADWYPSSKCCVNRYAGSPFCPECGTDFREESATFEPVVKVWSVEALMDRSEAPENVTGEVREAMAALEEGNASDALETLREALGSLDQETRTRGEFDGE